MMGAGPIGWDPKGTTAAKSTGKNVEIERGEKKLERGKTIY